MENIMLRNICDVYIVCNHASPRNMDLALLSQPDTWISLLTLTAMEIVLGIDNVIFISILVRKLPVAPQGAARRTGLSLALVMRLALLFAIAAGMRLTAPLFALFNHAFSGRDIILFGGGLFLVGKATYEIHDSVELLNLRLRGEALAGRATSPVRGRIGHPLPSAPQSLPHSKPPTPPPPRNS